LQGYTEGPQPLNWKQILKDVVRKPDFYLDVDPETGEKKDAGWVGLGMEEDEEGEEAAEEESEYSEDDGDDDESEEESDVSGGCMWFSAVVLWWLDRFVGLWSTG
jgi:nucleosome binding factor SPN SPT16 subunit